MNTKPSECRRVLAATDLTASSEAALQQAASLATRAALPLTLVHCLPHLRQLLLQASREARQDLLQGTGERFQREIRLRAEQQLQAWITRWEQTHGTPPQPFHHEVLLGTPYIAITHAVQQQGFDLVVVGSRGVGQRFPWTLGSTAQRLIRECPATVWVVKPDKTTLPRKILVATDFSETSRRAVQQAVWLAEVLPAELLIGHVVDSHDVPEEFLTHLPPGVTLQPAIESRARDLLEQHCQELVPSGISYQSLLGWGTPWQVLHDWQQQHHPELLVLGTQGRTGMKGWLLGNTAEKVLQHTESPLWVVKPAGFVSSIDPPFWPLTPPASRNAQ
ncbi:MAG: hypothetical protein KatS3mg113_1132 [Planctomycetaceae bacterium]|nr:MAG: hypothetical protein KatS3mg113_1132 [Planctomycetaceae bacterium]